MDPILLQKEKVRRAEDRLKVIAQRICQKEKVVDVVTGDFPKLKVVLSVLFLGVSWSRTLISILQLIVWDAAIVRGFVLWGIYR